MLRPIHLYLFRTFSALTWLIIASLAVTASVTLAQALVVFPTLLITAMVISAIIEQGLLHRMNWQATKPVPLHKFKLKPVRQHKHAGCKLLGLACPA